MKKLLVIAILIALILTGCKAQEITGGNIAIQNREFDKAISLFKQAAQKYPDKAEPYVSLSVPYHKKKYHKEAADALEKALQINEMETKEKVKWYENFLHTENYAWNVFYNGAVKYSDENFERALELVKRSESVETPKYKSYSYNLHGNILSMTGKVDEALTYYEKAIEADKTNIDPYLSLGRYYVIHTNPEKAVPYLEKALEIDNTVTETYIVLGQAYLDLEEYKKAIEVFKKSPPTLKENPGIQYNLALAYLKAEDYESALETGKKVIGMKDVDPVILSKAYDLIGQVYITKGKYNDAVSVLNDAVAENPNNCEAYHLMAIVYLKMKNNKLSSEYGDKWMECLGRE